MGLELTTDRYLPITSQTRYTSGRVLTSIAGRPWFNQQSIELIRALESARLFKLIMCSAMLVHSYRIPDYDMPFVQAIQILVVSVPRRNLFLSSSCCLCCLLHECYLHKYDMVWFIIYNDILSSSSVNIYQKCFISSYYVYKIEGLVSNKRLIALFYRSVKPLIFRPIRMPYFLKI